MTQVSFRLSSPSKLFFGSDLGEGFKLVFNNKFYIWDMIFYLKEWLTVSYRNSDVQSQ